MKHTTTKKSGNRSMEMLLLISLFVFGIYGVFTMGGRKGGPESYDQHEIIRMSDDLSMENTAELEKDGSVAGR